MLKTAGETARLLDLLGRGDDQARSRLIDHTCERLRTLTRRMLNDFPGVRRWEQTDDVWHRAFLRLWRALESVIPESPRHYYNLAARQIQRELIDLARHHLGPQGHGARHHTDHASQAPRDRACALDLLPSETGEPDSLEEWTAFHQAVERLPDEEREVFRLHWYEGLTLGEAASVLGQSLRTVKRRWQSARVRLAEALDGEVPQ